MSVARAFTRRGKRPELPDLSSKTPARAATVRKPGQKIDRAQISLPVALLSTTNMLSYNAPDIASLNVDSLRKASASSTSSLSSSDESVGSRSSGDSTGSVTDASSVASSPHSPTVSPNHLTNFFKSSRSNSVVKEQSSPKIESPKIEIPKIEHLRVESPRTGSPVRCESTFFSILSTANASSPTTVAPPSPAPVPTPAPISAPAPASTASPVSTPVPTPPIPSRAPSHSKRAHETVARTRSELSRSSSTISNTSSSRSIRIRPSAEALRRAERAESAVHPFGKELEQLDEVVEGFGDAVLEVSREEDTTVMQANHLLKFSVVDYLKEITPLFAGVFDGCGAPSNLEWI